MDFHSKKRLYAAVLKMNQIKSRQQQVSYTALSKGKELSTISLSWRSIQESFEKGTFSKALYGQLSEKKSRAIEGLSKDLFILERVQNVLNRQLNDLIKGNPEMIPLMMFDRISFDEKSGFRKSRILKGSDVWVLDGRTQYADVIVINKSNEILFTVRNRADDFEPGKYCLPGGHVDEGENAAEAARRELQEETGIEIPIEEFAPCGEYFDDKAHINYFCVSYDGDPLVLEFREQEQYEWVSIDEIKNKPLLMNLADNFVEIIEIPKSKINPIASNAEKYYFDGNLIEDQADKDFQALLDITREKLIKGEASLQEYLDIKKSRDVIETLFIKGESYKWDSRLEKASYLKKIPLAKPGKNGQKYRYIYNQPKKSVLNKFYQEVEKNNAAYKGGEITSPNKVHPRARLRKSLEILLKTQKGYVRSPITIKLPVFDIDKSTGKLVKIKNSDGSHMLGKMGVDLAWGFHNFKGSGESGAGLKHIIGKHYVMFNHFNSVKDLFDFIEESCKEVNDVEKDLGNFSYDIEYDSNNNPKLIVSNGKFSLILRVNFAEDLNGDVIFGGFILSDFELNPNWKSYKTDSSTFSQRLSEIKSKKIQPTP